MKWPVKRLGVFNPIYGALVVSLIAHAVLVNYLWRAWEHQQVRHAPLGHNSTLNFQVRVTLTAAHSKTAAQSDGSSPKVELHNLETQQRHIESVVSFSATSEEPPGSKALTEPAPTPLPIPLPVATVFQGSAALWNFGGVSIQGLRAAYQAQHARDITKDLQAQARAASLRPAEMNAHTNCMQARVPECIGSNSIEPD